MNGPIGFGGSINGPALWQARGVRAETILQQTSVRVRLYGDKVLQWEGFVGNEEPLRLPSGYKAVYWELELSGSVSLHSATIATTMRELERVA